MGKPVDNDRLQLAQISVQIQPHRIQIQQRVADQLPRPVIGNIAAAVDLVKGNPLFLQLLLAKQQMLRMPIRSHGICRRMLKKEQRLRALPPIDFLDITLLQFPCLAVRHHVNIAGAQHFRAVRQFSIRHGSFSSRP
ncbi:hypothetical protein D3C71_1808250 [compost metagenome]